MKRLLVVACVIGCCSSFGEGVTQAQGIDPATAQRVYIDDDDQRSLADLRFAVDSPNEQNLRITVSAVGPNVESIGGFRGVQGGNRYTAEELGLILNGVHEIAIVTSYEDGRRVTGRFSEGRSGTLPERRLLPTGRIDFLARTALEYPLELTVDPQTKASGLRTTLVVLNGQSRLRCRYSIVDGRIKDLEVQSLGHDTFLAARPINKRVPNRRFRLTAVPQSSPPISDNEWDKRDLEGKWVQLSTAIDKDPWSISGWVDFLVQKREFELLEWMAIYIPDLFKSHGVGEALIKANAPQWIRVSAWHNNGPPNLGHGLQQATSNMLHSSPGETEHWLAKHKDELDNWEISLQTVYATLKKDKFEPKDSSKYHPPLQPKSVFEHLTATQALADFGERMTAEEGVTYRHQVIRAINGVPVSGRRTPELLKTVRGLTVHKDEGIRIAALLSHTYLLPKASPNERFVDFVSMADDGSESQSVREAALMAFSYHRHPSVMLKLHQVATDPKHGAWNAAISRLGDIGHPWSEGLLRKLADAELTENQQRLLTDSLERLAARSAKNTMVGSSETANGIALAVFAEKTNDPHAKYILDAVLARATQMTDKRFRSFKIQMNFSRLPEIWLPCQREEFASRYEEIRASLQRSN